MKQLIVNIEVDVLERLKQVAECRKIPVKEVIIEAIEEHLEETEKLYILQSSFYIDPPEIDFMDEEPPMTLEYYKNYY